jgi:UDP-2-acetamido-2,6-beta-L-arabino-hexul-4-ose reductase
MKTILVTGAEGFVGRNLCVALQQQADFQVLSFDVHQPPEELPALAARADLVFHLAGVNRPKEEKEFMEGNADLTQALCAALRRAGRNTPLILSSSIQAASDNPYGRSKRAAEEVVLEHHSQTGDPVRVYRFPNVFGKWSRPNYNTVVATFCHNISRGLPVQVSNRANVIPLIYIDDLVRAFVEIAVAPQLDPGPTRAEIQPVFSITLGELYDLLLSFKQGREQSLIPDLSNLLVKYLHSTYLSFCEPEGLAYPVELKTDDRGWLFELIKSPRAGQIFVSSTKPGITRGNHYHHTKIEKFCVVQGRGVIRFRRLGDERVIEYPVSDQAIQVVDIPPGYTHSIENNGSSDMLTLFWANEIFDPQRPDTYFVKVK